MSEKYKKAMDEIKVTDEMRDRILSDIEKIDFRRKSRITLLTRYSLTAAVIAVAVISAVYIIPNESDDYVSTPQETVSEDVHSEQTTDSYVVQTKQTPETEIETEVETEIETEVETEIETEVETEIETEVETEIEKEVKTETETEVETKAETEAEAYTETETENESVVGDLFPSFMEALENVTELSKAVGFEVKDIENLPFEYESAKYVSIFGEIAEITYTGKNNTLTFRKGKGSDNVSGDYTIYEFTSDISEYNAVLSGNEKGLYKLVTWYDDEYSYSLLFSDGISESEIVSILKAIK